MKVLKKKILLSLSLPIDFFKQKEGFVYRPYSFIYFLVKFKHSSIRDAISQLVKSGEIDKIVKNGIAFFRLTGLGRERLLSFFPISLGQSRVWDRKWRLLIGNAKNLKPILNSFGFQKLTRGVYLTPMPVSEQLKSYLLEKRLISEAILIEAHRFLLTDDQKLAKKLWQLEELARKYRDFINKSRGVLKSLRTQKRLKNRDKNRVVDLFNAYFSLLSSDSGLPKKLLLPDWPADFAREIFLRIFVFLENEKLLDTI